MLELHKPVGTCLCCEREFTAAGMTKHLRSCAARLEAIAKADGGRRKRQDHYHVHVRSPYTGHFLHLEVRGNALLDDVDHYLRHIWLECCGHLSSFSVGNTFYTQIFEDDVFGGALFGAKEESMNIAVAKLFKPDLRVPYEYDFGSTTELELKVAAVREGRAVSGHPVTLMARNNYQAPPCAICDEKATSICLQCHESDDASVDAQAFACDAHIGVHDEHHDYGAPMPLCNSPRVGVCGYVGPAQPPY